MSETDDQTPYDHSSHDQGPYIFGERHGSGFGRSTGPASSEPPSEWVASGRPDGRPGAAPYPGSPQPPRQAPPAGQLPTGGPPPGHYRQAIEIPPASDRPEYRWPSGPPAGARDVTATARDATATAPDVTTAQSWYDPSNASPPPPPPTPPSAPSGTGFGPPPPPPARRPRRSSAWRTIAGVAAVAALVGGAVGGAAATFVHRGGSTGTSVHQVSVAKLAGNSTTNVQSVTDAVLPSVVFIKATSEVAVQSSPSEGFDPFGGGYGGYGSSSQPTMEKQVDEGTGMIVTSSGEVVTNDHVIAGATSLTVTLQGSSTKHKARVLGADPNDDVALIQIEGVSGLPTVTFGNSSKVAVGDSTVAIGYALGLSGGPTVTSGIISAEGRTVTAERDNGSTETLYKMFQTDAAINPGNSGGPLLDSDGQVIGMNSAAAGSDSDGTESQNIGFAIPSNRILSLLPELARADGGKVS